MSNPLYQPRAQHGKQEQQQQQHIPSPPSPLHLVGHDYHDQRLDTDDGSLGAGVLGSPQ